ncbi:MAG: DUF4199 domain-containing protein [Bacteroidales bacterium]|nr:DUF4199 domain-containing protein [Bacteroidales bacterium]
MAETGETNASIWTTAAKDAIFLSLFTIVPQLISNLISGGGTETGVLVSIAGFLLWAVKFGGSLWFLHRCMKLWVASGAKSSVFEQGLVTCLLSSIICTVFTYLMYAVLFPGIIETALSQASEAISAAQMTPDVEKAFLMLEDNFPMIMSVATFLWCMLCGLVFSAIFSNSLKSRASIFDDDAAAQEPDELL